MRWYLCNNAAIRFIVGPWDRLGQREGRLAIRISDDPLFPARLDKPKPSGTGDRNETYKNSKWFTDQMSITECIEFYRLAFVRTGRVPLGPLWELTAMIPCSSVFFKYVFTYASIVVNSRSKKCRILTSLPTLSQCSHSSCLPNPYLHTSLSVVQ